MTEQNNYDRSNEPGRGQLALRAALPLLLFTICAIGGASVLAVRNVINLSSSSAIYDATAVVCAAQAVPQAAPYTPADGLQKTVAFRQLLDGRLQIDSAVIPEAWQPTSLEETALVLCLVNERTAYRAKCAEDGQSDSPFTTEYGREITAVLRSAHSGEIIAEGQISSVPDAPEGCLAELPDAPPPNDDIPLSHIQAWLAPYVQSTTP
ncbi:MAG: hypothetical protein KDD89_09190 [Anaerolineales bacterium]|nr:hypothetical protein [Anaerolineales bacterium]